MKCLFLISGVVWVLFSGRIENVFFGRLVLVSILLMISVLIGVFFDGLSMNGYFVVIVGVILCVMRLSGKLNGVMKFIGFSGMWWV